MLGASYEFKQRKLKMQFANANKCELRRRRLLLKDQSEKNRPRKAATNYQGGKERSSKERVSFNMIGQ